MSETFTVTAAKYAGEKDNPHGGKLHKFYCSFSAEDGTEHQDVYWQRKTRELEAGEEFYGHIEQGEYGPRFKTDQQAGNFKAPAYSRSADGLSKDDYWRRKEERDMESQARQGRAHAQEMAIRYAAEVGGLKNLSEAQGDPRVHPPDTFKCLIDWFHEDVQRFPTSGGPEPENGSAVASAGREGSESDRQPQGDPSPEEASPAQKGKLTTLFNEAGLARGAQQAIVLFRCKQEKATKNGASQLIQDLLDGATAEALLAEIRDARANGDELAQRAAQLIPSDVPADTTGLAPLSAEDQAKYAA